MLLQGWQSTNDQALKPFQSCKDELSVQDGCILWGSRVLKPPTGHQKVIDELHTGYPGILRMKSLARSYVLWPGVDVDLESKVRNCHQCHQNQKSAPAVPGMAISVLVKNPHRLRWPSTRENVPGVVDAHSKWIEVSIVNSATSVSIIQKLRSMVATHGLPKVVVSDNGSVFTSSNL